MIVNYPLRNQTLGNKKKVKIEKFFRKVKRFTW